MLRRNRLNSVLLWRTENALKKKRNRFDRYFSLSPLFCVWTSIIVFTGIRKLYRVICIHMSFDRRDYNAVYVSGLHVFDFDYCLFFSCVWVLNLIIIVPKFFNLRIFFEIDKGNNCFLLKRLWHHVLFIFVSLSRFKFH